MFFPLVFRAGIRGGSVEICAQRAMLCSLQKMCTSGAAEKKGVVIMRVYSVVSLEIFEQKNMKAIFIIHEVEISWLRLL